MSSTEPAISNDERRVWLGICAGRTHHDIATDIGSTKRAVDHLRSALCAKLGIATRRGQSGSTAALVRAAAGLKLLRELPPLRLTEQSTSLAHW